MTLQPLPVKMNPTEFAMFGCAAVLSAFSVLVLLVSLEHISGDKWTPRIWWLGVNEEAGFFIRPEDPSQYVFPTEIETKTALGWTFQACMDSETVVQEPAYRAFIDKRLSKSVDRANDREVKRAFCSERYWIGYRSWQEYRSTPYGKAVWRLRKAIENQDRAMFWNQILGAVEHAFGFLLAMIVALYVLIRCSELIEKLKKRKSPPKAGAVTA